MNTKKEETIKKDEEKEEVKKLWQEEDIKEVAGIILKELKQDKFLKNDKSAYEKTEYLLYKFKALPVTIQVLKKEIKTLKKESLSIPRVPIKSKTLVLKENEGTYVYGDEILDARISELQQIVVKAQSYIRLVNNVLRRFKDDEYYPLIERIYFEHKNYDDISEEFGWAIGTISKHKSRLINEMKVFLFTDKFMSELGT